MAGFGTGLIMGMRVCRPAFLFSGIFILTLLTGGCGGLAVRHAPPSFPPPVKALEKKELPRMAYTIQAGAFASAENAARLTLSLQQKGLDATYFVARRGLYKVRFGNFPTKEQARVRAEELRNTGLIEEFYVVSPEEYAVAKREALGEAYLREELVRTARSFLGVAYLWGGTSSETGFDCSGLTMTVYQLSGFDLPRTSRDQFAAGSPVERSSLEKGDLLFFAGAGGKVSHVGIYAGNGLFIHAPGRGKKIRTDSLAKGHLSSSFVGARSYL
ncbi:MAG: NlpC/P60 family protein [Syntrophaceae bacterium]|nr:NlpC/P60 family protein [Syntrophaceae bacterium]